MIGELRAAPIFGGVRGRPAADVERAGRRDHVRATARDGPARRDRRTGHQPARAPGPRPRSRRPGRLDRGAPMTPAVTLCWGTVGASTLDELALAADAGGFDAISAMPAMAPRARRSTAADGGQLRRRLARGPPRVAADRRGRRRVTSTFFEPGVDGCFRSAGARRVHRCLNVAHFLGVAAPIGAMVDTFGALCERAAVHGAELTLEFIPGSGIPDLATALDIVTRTAAPNAGVLVDTWHLFAFGWDGRRPRRRTAGRAASAADQRSRHPRRGRCLRADVRPRAARRRRPALGRRSSMPCAATIRRRCSASRCSTPRSRRPRSPMPAPARRAATRRLLETLS